VTADGQVLRGPRAGQQRGSYDTDVSVGSIAACERDITAEPAAPASRSNRSTGAEGTGRVPPCGTLVASIEHEEQRWPTVACR
jgi:hypothetical protein